MIMKEGVSMAEIPKKDITGECEGECRDRVKEGEVVMETAQCCGM